MSRSRSWTGSESQRREQGDCRPPMSPINQAPRYLVPAGVCGFFRRADETQWRPWTTTCANGFDRFEHIEDGCPVFRSGGYLLMIEGRAVIQRDEPVLDFSRPVAVQQDRRDYQPAIRQRPRFGRRRSR